MERVENQVVVLVLMQYYCPAFKGGGPIRSVSNAAERLVGQVFFRIVTRDRDFGDATAFSDILADSWQMVGQAEVNYRTPAAIRPFPMLKLLRETPHDVLYLNSLLNWRFSVVPLVWRRLGLLPQRPVLLAPRGELSQGALSLKPAKKRVYIRLAKMLGLVRGVTWHASSALEQREIEQWFSDSGPDGGRPEVRVALNLGPALRGADGSPPPAHKAAGSLRLVFVSRITAKKNLDYLLRLLPGLSGQIALDIYGPIGRHQAFWARCQSLIADMPPHVVVTYHGPIPNEKVAAVFAAHHVFCFPTLGENYGHVVLESLLAGCPVVISDQTPWQDLEERGVGWVIPLAERDRYAQVLQELVDMGQATFDAYSKRARTYATQAAGDESVLEQNRRLFEGLVERHADG